MLEHVFAPFLECCGDAVMFTKRNVVVDDEDDVSTMTIVFLLIKVAWLYRLFLFLMFFKRSVLFV